MIFSDNFGVNLSKGSNALVRYISDIWVDGLADERYKVRAFLWDDFVTMMPLCGFDEYEIM